MGLDAEEHGGVVRLVVGVISAKRMPNSPIEGDLICLPASVQTRDSETRGGTLREEPTGRPTTPLHVVVPTGRTRATACLQQEVAPQTHIDTAMTPRTAVVRQLAVASRGAHGKGDCP
jgi:hypothetical protein